jgi:hypothetical protein
VVFICGEIKDLVSDADKHYTYLEDPDDVDLNGELNGFNDDEIEDLKRECVFFKLVLFAWLRNDYQVGNAATQLCENSTASFPISRRKSTRGRLRNSLSFIQRRVNLFYTFFTY